MKLSLTVHVFSFLFLFAITTTFAVSLSKPGCQEKCGNVAVPYPFGIGPNCSANSFFTLTCENSRPFLSGINMEARHISLQYRTLEVKLRVWPIDFSDDDQRNRSAHISLVGSPFNISASYNSLVAMGHISFWVLANETNTIAGCTPLSEDNSNNITSCNGVNCCQTTIEPCLKELRYVYQRSGARNNGPCSRAYVFPVDKKWLERDYKKHGGCRKFTFVPLVLEWEFYTPNKLGDEICPVGYEGNPYLPEGCTDIDECSNYTILNNCSGVCKNIPGSYKCDLGFEDKINRVVFFSIQSTLNGLVISFAAWTWARFIRKGIEANGRRKFFRLNGGLLLEQHLSATENGLEKTKLFSSNELAKATDHYNENRILGRGGQGTVYKGMLRDGRIVAVKKSQRLQQGDIQVFINEVVILSQVNHRNVVKLLGCCLETEVPHLVYEFIPNGTLYQHIHEPNEELPLIWDMRVRIAREVAGALAYLHSASSAPIYHRDIKSTNILLDDKYRAKIADFGTSRSVSIDQTHLTTRVVGTFGYMDPEYFRSSQFTGKSDVYSFGVVMVELLTGEKAISSVRIQEGIGLATHFLHSMEENQLFEIVDARVLSEGRTEEIMKMAELARKCLHLNSKMRPTMREVAHELEAIGVVEDGSNCLQNQNNMDHDSSDVAESDSFTLAVSI